MQIKFKIIEVDEEKKVNFDNYIKVKILNGEKCVGEFWQDLKTLKNNIAKIGENSYTNLSEYKDYL